MSRDRQFDGLDATPVSMVQLTTVHRRDDTRILHRQVQTLAQQGGLTLYLLVADGKGSDTRDVRGVPVRIVDMGKPRGGRIGRFVVGSFRAVVRIRKLRAVLVHFHDPELIPAGIILKCLGCKVVYDVHEDYPLQIMHKFWLPGPLRPVVAWMARAVEFLAAQIFDAVVCATPKAADRFPRRKTVTVQNFPVPAELMASAPTSYRARSKSFVYVGGIAAIRGARELVEAIGRLPEPARLELAGSFSPPSLQVELQAKSSWSRVNYHGWASRDQVAQLLGDALAGLVVLHPTQNYPDAYPVKMFEYMAAGLPVIASDFPLWRRIVEGAKCGLLVDPMDVSAIADAMAWILDHPHEAEVMGHLGRVAVEQTYNWTREAEKLVGLYGKMMKTA